MFVTVELVSIVKNAAVALWECQPFVRLVSCQLAVGWMIGWWDAKRLIYLSIEMMMICWGWYNRERHTHRVFSSLHTNQAAIIAVIGL